MESPFTVEDAIRIQSEHLQQWRVRLNKECYEFLCGKVIEHNAALYQRLVKGEKVDPYKVLRGQDLLSIVYTFKPAGE